jgi:hypothetical protein
MRRQHVTYVLLIGFAEMKAVVAYYRMTTDIIPEKLWKITKTSGRPTGEEAKIQIGNPNKRQTYY